MKRKISNFVIAGFIATVLTACASDDYAGSPAASYQTPQAEFEILKSRLIRTAAGLMRANAKLCPSTRTITGSGAPFEICTNKVAIEDSAIKNAQTNGDTILVTTSMIAALDDDELAFLIAHELAHSVNGDTSQLYNRPAFELAADRTGLFLMARAGYDIDAARTALEVLGIPALPASDTHPSGIIRMTGLSLAENQVRTALQSGVPLIP